MPGRNSQELKAPTLPVRFSTVMESDAAAADRINETTYLLATAAMDNSTIADLGLYSMHLKK